MPKFLIRVQWADGREPASENFIIRGANSLEALAIFRQTLDQRSANAIRRFTVSPISEPLRADSDSQPSEQSS